jgi:hypothetical protein
MGSPYRVQVEVLRSVANGSITNSYVALGAPLVYPSRIISFINSTDAPMLISVDGTNNHLVVPTGSTRVFDLTANRRSHDDIFAFAAKTQFYIKYVSAPSTGTFYIETLYGDAGS